ncbi:MAG: NirA family protein [Herpetosiphon sp.]
MTNTEYTNNDPSIHPFTEEQQQYLLGFVGGASVARAKAGLPTFSDSLAGLGLGLSNGTAPVAAQPVDKPEHSDPDAIHTTAQNRFLEQGKSLVVEEKAKRRKNPLDMWDEIEQHAVEGRFPKGTDIFAFKFRGLFYVAPAQNAFMCRLRFAGGIVTAEQLANVASIAERLAGGYADVTTRANLQLREIRPESTVEVLNDLQDCGIVTRGAGADNIRNITGSPTAGIDPQELIDTRPLTRQLHHYILNHRELYGLPRKFNIAFDGGGSISAVADTNDIGFAAVRILEGQTRPAGIYFRLQLGGITGHGDFARDAGVALTPAECVPMAAAVVRVFIDHGDRTDRKKARLKYVLDRMGLDQFMVEVRRYLAFEPVKIPLEACELPAPVNKHGHIGVHPQLQDGFSYVGVLLPVGRMNVAQMRGLATLANRYGSGTLRLTVWQNVLLSDVSTSDVAALQAEIAALGLTCAATSVRGGLVACTGNVGCKYSATDTKSHALAIADYLEGHIVLDQPVNMHLTGCAHSCAQHYIGDLGFLGTQVAVGDEIVEGYHLFVGGGYGEQQQLARQIYQDIPATEAPAVTEKMLQTYMSHRASADESFAAWTQRFSIDELKALFAEQPVVVG